jgi:cation-transporting ATPase I
MTKDLKRALERTEGVDWAEIDAIVGRAVVLFDPESVELDDLIGVVEAVEGAHDASDERFSHDAPIHPTDVESIQRNAVVLAADTLGLGFATVGQLLRLAHLPAEASGFVSLLESRPRVQRFLIDRLGAPATDMLTASRSTVALAFSQAPVALLADMAHRGSLIAEQVGRRTAWERMEPDLVEGPHSVRHAPIESPPRSPDLPKGPIEQYAETATLTSLAGAGVAFGVTLRPRHATSMLFAGLPTAATLGREAFAASLDMTLSARDVLVMDPAALRRLDRVDTLVIDARILRSGRWSLDRLETTAAETDAAACAAKVRTMLDHDHPDACSTRGPWRLLPWAADDRAPRGTASRARRLARGGRRSLGLWHGEDLLAIAAVAEDPIPLATDLVAKARAIGLDIVIAGGSDALAERFGDAARWTTTHIVDQIRAHQADGHMVAFVSGRAHDGLQAADIGIGVETPGDRAPLGAHIVIRSDLGQSWLLLDAITRARAVSQRSVMVALAGASTGGAWALVGPARTAAQRTMLAVSISALAAQASGAFAGLTVRAVSPPDSASGHQWHEIDGTDVLDLVGSTTGGLEADEQAARRTAEVARTRHEPVRLLQAAIDELDNPLTPILGLGAALSAAVGSLTDAVLVLSVVGLNSLVGAAQRVHTDRALTELESNGDTVVRVLVAGTAIEVPAHSVVVGDVIQLEAGDTVPGDCRLLDTAALEVDESTLTGESMPVAKSTATTPGAVVAERTSMLYEGTVIAVGEATAVVIAVGNHTEAGRSLAAAAAPPPSGVERRLSHLTNLTVPVTLGAGAVATGLGLLWRRPPSDAIGSGVSLMVAAVPEGLPALATLAQVASARRLASRNALVRNPRAVEALGRVNQVCFDKTGTLTEGKVSLATVSSGLDEQALGSITATAVEVLAAARRATPASNGNGTLPHATDRAVVEAAERAGLGDEATGWERIDDLPFESTRSMHAVLGRHGRSRSVAVKGAPETVLPLCVAWKHDGGEQALDIESLRLLEEHIESMGRRGLRVLAVATAPAVSGARLVEASNLPPLTLVGFVAFADLVRPTAAAAVATLVEAGVHVSMITGDHPSTAEAIAAELGMLNGGRVLTGFELDALDDDDLDDVIDDVAVFARVTPLQKVRIVASHQRLGHSVAMTGDGANDAAAIRLADAGIALGGRGTDAARSAADVVVTDDRIETIVDAVVEGRAMWESVRSAVAILVGGNLGEIGFTLVGTAMGGTAPLNPRQLLLVNLLTDMAPALAIAMREPPDRSPETLLHAGPDSSLGMALTRDIAIRAGATASGATGAWAFARFTGTPARARTIGLAALVGTQLGQTLVVGGTSPVVLGATAVSIGILIGVVQTPGLSRFFGCRPLGPVGWSTAIAASAVATTGSVVVPWAAERAGRAIVATTTDAPHDPEATDGTSGAAAEAASPIAPSVDPSDQPIS